MASGVGLEFGSNGVRGSWTMVRPVGQVVLLEVLMLVRLKVISAMLVRLKVIGAGWLRWKGISAMLVRLVMSKNAWCVVGGSMRCLFAGKGSVRCLFA